MKKAGVTFPFLFFCFCSFGQISGNRIYGRSGSESNYNYSQQAPPLNNGIIVEGDSVMYINTSVLLNTKADHYLLVLGLNEVSATTKESLDQINLRIAGFLSAVTSNNIKKQDVFVDFISQTKVYNYDIKTSQDVNIATQKLTGIQTKKNINIRFDNIEILDQLLEKASAFNIHDIIKVDYITDDVNAIHKQMFAEADRIINEKKNSYLKVSEFELLPFFYVNTDNFYGVYPAGQYRDYTAFETGTVSENYYQGNLIKKDELMSKTYFYEGVSVATFDKVINGGTPYVGVQFVLSYGVKYFLKHK